MEMRFSDSRPTGPGVSTTGLRPLDWRELCARLVAAHDTRGVLAGTVAGPGGEPGIGTSPGLDGSASPPHAGKGFSFHEPAAALLKSVEMEAEGAVNPASSANGNDVQGNNRPIPNVAPQRRPGEN